MRWEQNNLSYYAPMVLFPCERKIYNTDVAKETKKQIQEELLWQTDFPILIGGVIVAVLISTIKRILTIIIMSGDVPSAGIRIAFRQITFTNPTRIIEIITIKSSKNRLLFHPLHTAPRPSCFMAGMGVVFAEHLTDSGNNLFQSLRVRLISLGIMTLPRSSTWHTMPVPFI